MQPVEIVINILKSFFCFSVFHDHFNVFLNEILDELCLFASGKEEVLKGGGFDVIVADLIGGERAIAWREDAEDLSSGVCAPINKFKGFNAA